MKVTPSGYATVTRLIKEMAQLHCQGRLVTILEGGYNLETLAASAQAHVEALMK
jgi:acetoin utilization deacetylase AcuC-like enzyme